jgi:hypothetical protein
VDSTAAGRGVLGVFHGVVHIGEIKDRGVGIL